MQKISLKIEEAFAIPVHHTIHAKRGDYLFVAQTGEIKVVDGKTYQALKLISNEQERGLQKEKDLEEAKELFPCKTKLRETLREILLESPSGITTGEIMEILLPSNGEPRRGANNKNAYNRIYHALDWLVTHQKAEKIVIQNEKGEPVRLWAWEKN